MLREKSTMYNAAPRVLLAPEYPPRQRVFVSSILDMV
jgi:hypothetical protein